MRWLLALVLVVSLSGCTDGGGDRDWWADPPEGMRWVGDSGVVVAVADWWTTDDTRCGAPVEDTVYFDSGAVYDCANPVDLDTVREVSSLAVLRANGRYDAGDLDGDCEEWFAGVCRRLFALADTPVVFAVTIADVGDGSYERIRDSARELPEGVTTVPLAVAGGWTPSWGADPSVVPDLREALEAVGLRVEVKPADVSEGGDVADLPSGSLLGVEPALGTPVADGSTVTLTVMP